MLHLGQDVAVRGPVATQAIGDDALRLVLEPREQVLEEALRSRGITAVLHQNVEHNTILVPRTPEIVQLAVDP
jgi:hypothetical protein